MPARTSSASTSSSASAGQATDDLVVELPADRLADSLVTAAASVPGVRVESIRPYAGRDRPVPGAGAAGEAGGQHSPTRRRCSPTGSAGCSGRAGRWCCRPRIRTGSLHGDRPQRCRPGDRHPGHPVVAADAGPRSLQPGRGLGAAGLGQPGHRAGGGAARRDAVLVGRPALRWLASEIIRMSHLASIAATVLDGLTRDRSGPSRCGRLAAAQAMLGQSDPATVSDGCCAGRAATRCRRRPVTRRSGPLRARPPGPAPSSTRKPASSRTGTFSSTALACLLPGDSPTTTNEVFFDTELADLPPRAVIASAASSRL